ncbi:MAG: DNA polymerase III subunit delta' [Crocinitomicaceae bacterium]
MQFSDVIGQSELKAQLIHEVVADKISHAQLFLGKPGYGTLPLALAFVQFIMCENNLDSDSCGICPSCQKNQKHQHPDVHFSFPTVQAISKTASPLLNDWREQLSETPYFDLNSWIKKSDDKERKPIISVHESQEIIKKLSLRSYEGGYKVMVIWQPEEMNISCANKLLKILEEPPARTLFILVAESHEKMLQTILSRTQTLIVPRLKLEDVSGTLVEKMHFGRDYAESIAARSDGDLIESSDIASNSAEKNENYHQFTQLMRVCYKKNVIDMMDWGDSISNRSKEGQKEFLKYALHMFRQSILRNYTENHLTRVSQDEDGFLGNFSKFITGNNIQDFFTSFNDAHYYLERNANSKILFTNLCFQVMRFIHAA